MMTCKIVTHDHQELLEARQDQHIECTRSFHIPTCLRVLLYALSELVQCLSTYQLFQYKHLLPQCYWLNIASLCILRLQQSCYKQAIHVFSRSTRLDFSVIDRSMLVVYGQLFPSLFSQIFLLILPNFSCFNQLFPSSSIYTELLTEHYKSVVPFLVLDPKTMSTHVLPSLHLGSQFTEQYNQHTT